METDFKYIEIELSINLPDQTIYLYQKILSEWLF